MTEESKRKCDPEDILCQMQVLGHLRGIQSVLGNDKFKSDFPELVNLDKTFSERIASSETRLKETLEECGILTRSEPLEGIEPPSILSSGEEE